MEPTKEPVKAPAKSPIQDLTNVAQPRYTRYITILSVLSCFGVIIIHINDSTFHAFDGSLNWFCANTIKFVFHFAAPVFFMISGATLMDYRKRYDTKTFVKKRVRKTVIPFLVWSLISLIICILYDTTYTLSDFSFQFLLDGFINTKFNHTYWFFIPLFACYAWIIVLSLIPDEHKQKVFPVVIICDFLTVFLLNSANISLSDGYLTFVLLGYCVYKYDMKLRTRIIIYCLGLAGFLILFFGTYIESFHTGETIRIYETKISVPSFLYSLAIFTFFRYLKPNKFFDFIYKICKFFAPLTFGIFLIHSLVLNLLVKKILANHDVWIQAVGAVGTFLLCAAIVWIIQCIPLIKKLIPK